MERRKLIYLNVVSPHRDDAALSLCLTLMSLASVGNKVRIISCFTVSSWAPRYTGEITIDGVASLRRREDEAFVAKYSGTVDLHSLDFVDALLREGAEQTIVGRETVRQPFTPDSEPVQKLASALRSYNTSGCIWLAPLGIRHRDHLVSLWAAANVVAEGPLIIYEDIPYSLRLSCDEISAKVGALETTLKRSFTPVYFQPNVSTESWLEYLSCYESQFSNDELTEFVKGIRNQGGERLWMDQSALKMLFGGSRQCQLSLYAR